MEFDDPENQKIMEDFIKAIGATRLSSHSAMSAAADT